MNELTKKIEAILFSVGDRVSIEEIQKLTKVRDLEKIKQALIEFRDNMNKSDSSLVLHQEGNFWKLNVREEHLPTVRKVVKKMELPKTLLETLAVIAWKSPVLQSKVIAVRTNKAYDHLDELEKKAYITRKKHGRTKMITITQKFYDYFEINKKGGMNKIFRRVTERAKKKFPESNMFEEQQKLGQEENVEISSESVATDKNISMVIQDDSETENNEISPQAESEDTPNENNVSMVTQDDSQNTINENSKITPDIEGEDISQDIPIETQEPEEILQNQTTEDQEKDISTEKPSKELQ